MTKKGWTKADKIRGMTDAELAEFLSEVYYAGYFDRDQDRFGPDKYDLRWLKEKEE